MSRQVSQLAAHAYADDLEAARARIERLDNGRSIREERALRLKPTLFD